MGIYIVAILNFLLALFDAQLTARRMHQYGDQIEVNGFIKYLSTKLGPDFAAYIGTAGAALVQNWVCLSLGLGLPLAFLTGVRFKLWTFQVQSLIFEKKLRAFKMHLDKVRAAESATLPDSGVDTPTSPAALSPSSDKDKQ
jgi:hypothetical protein